MIPDDITERIVRLHYVERWKVGTIAAQVGVHHSTVKRILRDHGVDVTRTEQRSIVDPYLPFIYEVLGQYPTLPASRLYTMVVERGYPGAPDHFRAIIAKIRPKPPAEAYLRLRTLPAEEAQMDWGYFGKVSVERATRVLSAFVMVLSWSRMPFVRFFYDQRMPSFLCGHVEALSFFGGVPRRVLYDNLKSAVLERKGDAIRFHPTLLELAGHYRFEPRPVAVARGNEKGRVERKIRDLRTSFWPGLEWDNLDDLNAKAKAWCLDVAGARKNPDDDTLTVVQAWEDERPKLLPLPDDDYPAEERVEVKAGKQPYVRFDSNDYSVPHDRVRRALTIVASPERVRVVQDSEIIAVHQRSFDRDQQIEDPTHIEALVAQKKEARKQRAMDRLHHAVPAVGTLLEGAAQRGHNLGSAVAALDRLLDTFGVEELAIAVAEAIGADALHVAAVRQVLERRRHEAGQPPALPVALPDDPRVRSATVKPHDLKTYNMDEVSDG